MPWEVILHWHFTEIKPKTNTNNKTKKKKKTFLEHVPFSLNITLLEYFQVFHGKRQISPVCFVLEAFVNFLQLKLQYQLRFWGIIPETQVKFPSFQINSLTYIYILIHPFSFLIYCRLLIMSILLIIVFIYIFTCHPV